MIGPLAPLSPPPSPRHGAEALDLCLTSILGREFGSIRQRSKLNVQVGQGWLQAGLAGQGLDVVAGGRGFGSGAEGGM